MAGRWYLDWIEQCGNRLSMRDDQGNYLDGYTVWRFVRGLEAGPLEIGIERRDAPPPGPAPVVVLSGYRRQYVNAAGVFDEAFRPGEFTQSMCNPWTHDFRDCACHYWASNHPDVVMGGPLLGDKPSDTPDPSAAMRLDWLRRRNGSSEVSAAATIAENKRYQIDHYEINQSWEKLPFVLEGHEIQNVYRPPQPVFGDPHQDAAWLVAELEKELAGMEMALVIEYLYALFSLRHPDEATDPAWPSLADDLRAGKVLDEQDALGAGRGGGLEVSDALVVGDEVAVEGPAGIDRVLGSYSDQLMIGSMRADCATLPGSASRTTIFPCALAAVMLV